MNLVVGATGRLGGEICRRLRERGQPVRGLVRPGSAKESALAGIGAEVAHGDLKDPASLMAACRGATAVAFTATSTASRRAGDGIESVDRRGALAALEAARRAGVARFVYVSVSPNLPADSPLVRAKRELEGALRSSGLRFTILQPSFFMEVWFGPHLGWDLARGRAQVFGGGQARLSYISTDDVAECAVLALLRPGWAGRALPLGGPEAVSPLEAVRIFERVLGRRFQVRHVPLALPLVLSRLLRPFDPVRSSLMALAAASARGDAIDMAPLLAEEPIRLTSLGDFARAESAPRRVG